MLNIEVAYVQGLERWWTVSHIFPIQQYKNSYTIIVPRKSKIMSESNDFTALSFANIFSVILYQQSDG